MLEDALKTIAETSSFRVYELKEKTARLTADQIKESENADKKRKRPEKDPKIGDDKVRHKGKKQKRRRVSKRG